MTQPVLRLVTVPGEPGPVRYLASHPSGLADFSGDRVSEYLFEARHGVVNPQVVSVAKTYRTLDVPVAQWTDTTLDANLRVKSAAQFVRLRRVDAHIPDGKSILKGEYKGPGKQHLWIDACDFTGDGDSRLFHSGHWESVWITNCTAKGVSRAFCGATLVRDCHAEDCSEAFTSSACLFNVTARNVRKAQPSDHPDVYQITGKGDLENFAVSGLKATDVHCQGLSFDDADSISSVLIHDVKIEHAKLVDSTKGQNSYVKAPLHGAVFDGWDEEWRVICYDEAAGSSEWLVQNCTFAVPPTYQPGYDGPRFDSVTVAPPPIVVQPPADVPPPPVSIPTDASRLLVLENEVAVLKAETADLQRRLEAMARGLMG